MLASSIHFFHINRKHNVRIALTAMIVMSKGKGTCMTTDWDL